MNARALACMAAAKAVGRRKFWSSVARSRCSHRSPRTAAQPGHRPTLGVPSRLARSRQQARAHILLPHPANARLEVCRLCPTSPQVNPHDPCGRECVPADGDRQDRIDSGHHLSENRPNPSLGLWFRINLQIPMELEPLLDSGCALNLAHRQDGVEARQGRRWGI